MPPTFGVYKTRRLGHPAAVAYETWIDPTVRVPPIVEMQADVRVGGEVRIVIETGGRRSTMLGRYLAVEPHRRLQYTWCWSDRGGESLVSVEFRDVGPHCRLTLTHEGFTNPADREAHQLAWEAYLRQLERELAVRSEARCG